MFLIKSFGHTSCSLARLLILTITLSSCASGPIKKSPKISSPSHELAAGETIHEQIMNDFQAYPDAKLNDYVQEIVLRLTQHAKRKNLNYRATILQDERIYATSAPGGEIFITTGFLAFLKNESELASVVGHEVGQLQFLAPQFNPVRKTMNGITQVGSMVGPMLGQIGALASLGLVALHATYVRDPDLQSRILASDQWAMEAMVKEGYDPQSTLDVMEHFAKYDRQALSLFYDYYQSRPISVPRLKAAHEAFGKLKLDGVDLKTNFEQYKTNTKNLRTLAE